jgi:hypothetical protein
VHRFHRTTNPGIHVAMTARNGRWAEVVVQVYYEGHWQQTGAQYYRLDASGHVSTTLTGTHTTGYTFRVSASYLHGATASGDTANTTTHGPWVYLDFA